MMQSSLKKLLTAASILACTISIGVHATALTPQESKELECKRQVLKDFHQAPNVELLSAFCIDSYMLQQLLGIAEARGDLKSFDAILKLGAQHRNENCARLKLSILNHDFEKARDLFDRGVSARCKSGGVTAMQALFKTGPSNAEQTFWQIKLLADAGALVSPRLLLQSIREKNYALMSAALEFRDPNFSLNQRTEARKLTQILNPLILAITMADDKAVRILLDGGVDTSLDEAIQLIEKEDGLRFITGYSYFRYAQRHQHRLATWLSGNPGNDELRERQHAISATISLLTPTPAQRELQLLNDEGFELKRQQIKLIAAITQRAHLVVASLLDDLNPDFGLEHGVPDPRRYRQSRKIKTDDLYNPLVLALTLADSDSVGLLLDAGANADAQLEIIDADPEFTGSGRVQYSIREYGRNVLYVLFRRSRDFPKAWEITEQDIDIIVARLELESD